MIFNRTRLWLFLFLTSASVANATIGDNVYYTWEGVKQYASDGWKWVRYETAHGIENSVKASDKVYQVVIGSPDIDERLVPYISGEDLAVLQKNGVDLKVVETGLAGQQTATNNIYVNLSEIQKRDPSFGMTLIHHEVQHVLDNQKLKEAGYSATDLGHVGTLTLDNASQGLLQGILEARAYGEQIAFAYENSQLYKNNEGWKETYSFFAKNEISGQAFDKAIRQGKSVDEARKAASLAVINSDFFKKNYLDMWVQAKSDHLTSLSLEELLNIINDDRLTKEDFLSAADFWKNLCSYKTTENSDACLAYRARQRAYCAEVKEKWGSCKQLAATLAGDKLGGRMFTTEKDDALYEACCKKE